MLGSMLRHGHAHLAGTLGLLPLFLGCVATPPPEPANPSPAASSSNGQSAADQAGDDASAYRGYTGSAADVLKQYAQTADAARTRRAQLTKQLETATPLDQLRLHVRVATLYEDLAERLALTREPHVRLLTGAQEQLLKEANDSGDQARIDKAAAVRAQMRETWRKVTAQEMALAAMIVVSHYDQAAVLVAEHSLAGKEVDAAMAHRDLIAKELGSDALNAIREQLAEDSEGASQASQAGPATARKQIVCMDPLQ